MAQVGMAVLVAAVAAAVASVIGGITPIQRSFPQVLQLAAKVARVALARKAIADVS
jgi:hypothetical protein